MKYTINIDKLIVGLKMNGVESFNYQYIRNNYSFKGNTYSLSSRLEIRKFRPKKLETNYLNSFEVWSDEVKIGTLHTDCRLPQAVGTVKFEFSNHVFYTQPGFTHYLDYLTRVGLWVETVSFFEIALDAQLQKPLLPRLSHIERHSTLDKHNPNPLYRPLTKITVSKKENGAGYVFGKSATGSAGNGKSIVIYNKTEDIQAKEKSFISAFHSLNGLTPGFDVERVEAKISNRWLAGNKLDISVYDLSKPEILKTLFIKAAADNFKFVNIKGKKKYDCNRNYKAVVINLFPQIDSLQAMPVILPARPAITVETSDNVKRTTYKTLLYQFIRTGNRETAAAIWHFRNSNTPPKNANWNDLTTLYAQQFPDAPTVESKERIAQIHSYLKPTIKYGLPYEVRLKQMACY